MSATRSHARRLPAAVAALLVAASLTAAASARQTTVVAPTGDRTLDERFAEVGARVPGFAGTYVDEARKRLMVLAINPSPAVAQAAKTALIDVLGDTSLNTLTPVAVKASHPFALLRRWHDKVSRDVLAIPGVVFTDLDDVNNQIAVGVEAPLALGALIRSRVAALGVPVAAVSIEKAAPFRFASSLRDRHRPVVGGLQIVSSKGTCTFGFNAIRGSVSGWVTNSHCTATQGGVESTAFFQPTNLLTNRVGTESVDPAYFTGGACPAGRRCRYSDTAFATAGGTGATFTRGMVAASPINSYSWNGTDKFRIINETTPLIGQAIAKIGRTTGRTLGTVINQCLNINVLNTNITLLCQSRADLVSDSGDSGSPMIRNETSIGTDVSLKGILWGGDATTTAFSSIGQIIRSDEMGQITTCAAGFAC